MTYIRFSSDVEFVKIFIFEAYKAVWPPLSPQGVISLLVATLPPPPPDGPPY
jgi:hypothetical protein